MRRRIYIVGLLLAAGLAAGKDLHAWTDAKGRQVKTAFVKRGGAQRSDRSGVGGRQPGEIDQQGGFLDQKS
jgi:hypothetical protein